VIIKTPGDSYMYSVGGYYFLQQVIEDIDECSLLRPKLKYFSQYFTYSSSKFYSSNYQL